MPNGVKRSGDPEPFREDKLREGIGHAIYKRPVSPEMVDHAVDSVMRKLRGTGDRDVPSRQVGEWVMEELRDRDHVAYVRFAAISRAFEVVNAFRYAIVHLPAQPRAGERHQQVLWIASNAGIGTRSGRE